MRTSTKFKSDGEGLIVRDDEVEKQGRETTEEEKRLPCMFASRIQLVLVCPPRLQ